MNWKTWAPLVLAIALGLVAMKVARDVMAGKENVAGNPGATQQIVVVKSDLPAGSTLSAAQLGTIRVGKDVNTAAVCTNPVELEGRVLIANAVKGSPVLQSMLAPTGSGGGLQALIPDGMRAITVEINEFSGLAGYLVPGCRVDVVATINGEGGELISRTIVQNVRVQAVGAKQAQDQSSPIKSVTLIVNPKESEAIELAAATGKPRLVLRSSSDNDPANTDGVTVAELHGSGSRVHSDPFAVRQADTAPATQPATPPVIQATQWNTRPQRPQRQVTIIRGGVESEVSIEDASAMPAPFKWMTSLGLGEVPSSQN